MTAVQLADRIGVDPKTVERWVTQGRTPYPKHRQAIAIRLDERETYLWPDAEVRNERSESNSELITFYPHRSMVPGDLWDRLLRQATSSVDILVYVGMFMTEKPELLASLRGKATRDGVRIRLLFGDRNSAAVLQRSADERIGLHTISAKIDHVLAHFAPLRGVEGVETRLHGTVLYNSIYRFDDEMIVNLHVYGKIASHAPALHLKRLSSGTNDLFNMYAESFDAVWDGATPHA